MDDERNLLLISNSTLYGRGYLDHAESAIRELMRDMTQVMFVPYALFDRGAYAVKAKARFAEMGFTLCSVHDISNQARAVREAEAIFVGGGNTFRLVKALHECGLISPIRDAVAAGAPA